MKSKKPAAQDSSAPAQKHEGFSAEERDAMKERAKEQKAARRKTKADPEVEVLAKIAEMAEPDRALAGKLHEIVKASAPELTPRLWYGMPAYALDGKVLCFFQGAQKFKTRYATLGFSDQAALDDGALWPTSYALAELTPAVEKRVAALLRQSLG